MSNAETIDAPDGRAARAAERRLILSYSPTPQAGRALVALLDLDDTLADVLRHVSEPMIAQMRLTWWHDAIGKLDDAPPPAQPVLQALARDVVATGTKGVDVAGLIEGWEALLDGDPADPETRRLFAEGRGGRLFRLATDDDAVEQAGQGWALADLARSVQDEQVANAAADEARALLSGALHRRWPRQLRAVGALAHQAAMDLRTPIGRPVPAATPGRIGRLAWHRLTGR